MAKARGLDVSHWVRPDWAHWLNLGFIFAYLKATEGTGWTDNKLDDHYNEASEYYRGPYHYFRVQYNGALQATHFYNTVKGYTWDMPPVIDVERINNGGYSKAVFAARLRNCLINTERLFGIRPMIYTSQSMWHQKVGSVSWASAYDLWVAHYTTYPIPLIPNDWNGTGYKMWQYIDRPIDQNRFDGDEEAFKIWAGISAPPPTGDLEKRLTALENRDTAVHAAYHGGN